MLDIMDKLASLLERVPEPYYYVWPRFANWLYRWRRICIFCVDCEQEDDVDDTHWYCTFKNDTEIDWQDTCRAFKRKRRW